MQTEKSEEKDVQKPVKSTKNRVKMRTKDFERCGSTRTSGSKQSASILNTKKRQKERLEKRREERKNLEEKAAERRAERKEQMDKLTEDGEAESFTVSATGIDMKSVTQNLIAAVSGTSVPAWGSFDIKA